MRAATATFIAASVRPVADAPLAPVGMARRRDGRSLHFLP